MISPGQGQGQDKETTRLGAESARQRPRGAGEEAEKAAYSRDAEMLAPGLAGTQTTELLGILFSDAICGSSL